MKILWLSHLIPYPPKGGVLQRSYNMVRELSRYHEVDLLAFNQVNLIQPLFESLEAGVAEADSVLKGICRRHQFFDVPVDSHKAQKYWVALLGVFGRPYNLRWLESDAYAAAVKEWTSQTQYDIVHFDTISLLPYLDSMVRPAATVLDHHNIESHMLLRRAENEPSWLKRMYYGREGRLVEAFEKRYCPQFSLNITCSDIDTERLREISPQSKVMTIPNGVDLGYFVPQGLEKQPQKLVFVGTLNWYPNIEAVLYIAKELWPRLKQKFPDICIDIIGANPPAEIKEIAKADKSFRVLGFVDDIRPYIESAAVYLCPIRDGGGTKLKVLDAMALGAPMVAHPIACEGIAVADREDVLFAESTDDFIARVSELLESETLRKHLSTNARAVIEKNYGYEAIGKQLSSAYERCVGGVN
ncbi:MAG: glycosyltransferase [Spongiibacteraceae bacterium]